MQLKRLQVASGHPFFVAGLQPLVFRDDSLLPILISFFGTSSGSRAALFSFRWQHALLSDVLERNGLHFPYRQLGNVRASEHLSHDRRDQIELVNATLLLFQEVDTDEHLLESVTLDHEVRSHL